MRKRKIWLTIAALATGLALWALPVLAQEVPGPVPPTPVPPAVQPDTKPLSLAELGHMLDMLGYNPKPYNNKDGQLAGYDLEFPSGTWTMRMSVSLSGDKSNIWINSNIQTLGSPSSVAVDGLLKLLAENNTVWPAYIYYVEGTRALRLAMPIPNSKLTPGLLRSKVETFSFNIQRLIPLWRSMQTPTVPRPAPVPRL